MWWPSWVVDNNQTCLLQYIFYLHYNVCVFSPPGRNAWCFLPQRTLRTLSTALSLGCRKQRAWLQTQTRVCDSSAALSLKFETCMKRKALTPGLLEAEDVHAAHGCDLNYLTNTTVHGADLREKDWSRHARLVTQ